MNSLLSTKILIVFGELSWELVMFLAILLN